LMLWTRRSEPTFTFGGRVSGQWKTSPEPTGPPDDVATAAVAGPGVGPAVAAVAEGAVAAQEVMGRAATGRGAVVDGAAVAVSTVESAAAACGAEA